MAMPAHMGPNEKPGYDSDLRISQEETEGAEVI